MRQPSRRARQRGTTVGRVIWYPPLFEMMESGRINRPSTHHNSKPPPQNYKRTLPFWCMLALPLLLNIPCPAGADQGYSHQPFKWSLIRWEDQVIINQVTTAGAPSFLTSLCQLAPTSLCLNQIDFYLCPSSNPGRGPVEIDASKLPAVKRYQPSPD